MQSKLLRDYIKLLINEISLGRKNADITLSSTDKVAKQISPSIFDMVLSSYAKVGGNAKIKKPTDLTSEYERWIVADVDQDDNPDVFVGGNQRNGKMKMGIFATDGSQRAKEYLNLLQKRLYEKGWFAEVSDAPAHIAINKLGVPTVSDEEKVRELLGDKEITWHGEHPENKFPGTYGWYSRDIGGEDHIKIIVGNV